MKFGVVIKSTILNRFVLHTLQRNITHLTIITRKTNIKLGILKGGNWKRAKGIRAFFRFSRIVFTAKKGEINAVLKTLDFNCGGRRSKPCSELS